MTISSRRASSIYNRFNYTIADVINFSDPSPANYTPNDFFGFYEAIFNIPENQTGFSMSTQYRFLLTISTFLQSTEDNQIVSGVGARQAKFEAFLSTPIAIFNDAWQGQQVAEGMGTNIALAEQSYRVPSLRIGLM